MKTLLHWTEPFAYQAHLERSPIGTWCLCAGMSLPFGAAATLGWAGNSEYVRARHVAAGVAVVVILTLLYRFFLIFTARAEVRLSGDGIRRITTRFGPGQFTRYEEIEEAHVVREKQFTLLRLRLRADCPAIRRVTVSGLPARLSFDQLAATLEERGVRLRDERARTPA